MVLLLSAMVAATTIGAAGVPLGRVVAAIGLTHGDPAFIARDLAGALVDQTAAHRARPRHRRAARGRRHRHAGTVPQPARRPRAGRSVERRGACGCRHHRGRGSISGIGGRSSPVRNAADHRVHGSAAATGILYRIATREGRTSIALFLLGGLAIAALANAGLGLLVFLADDRQLRDINFWMLGSLAGATWSKVGAIAPFLAGTAAILPFIARGLDLMVLGEFEAFHAGIEPQRLKRICVVVVAAATGAAVSVSGVIEFIGLVVPHLLRLMRPGPSSPSAVDALARSNPPSGRCDSVARTLAAPAELPIGILTAVIGAPFFLYLLQRQRLLVGA